MAAVHLQAKHGTKDMIREDCEDPTGPGSVSLKLKVR